MRKASSDDWWSSDLDLSRSRSLSRSLSIYLSLSLSICLSVCLSVSHFFAASQIKLIKTGIIFRMPGNYRHSQDNLHLWASHGMSDRSSFD